MSEGKWHSAVVRIAASSALVLLAGAAAGGCHRQAMPGPPEPPSSPEGLPDTGPDKPVVAAPLRVKRQIDAAVPVTGAPGAGQGVVRLTREGRLVDRGERTALEVVELAPDAVRFSRAYVLWHRLPPGHDLALRPGMRVEVDFRPTSTAGSDEVSVTVYEAAVGGARGVVLLQAVERGGSSPVRISEADYFVEQLDRGEPVLETATELTTRPAVQVVAGEQHWTLGPAPAQPLEFFAKEIPYRITLLRSLRFQPKEGRHSFEGPPYLLEFVLTRPARP